MGNENYNENENNDIEQCERYYLEANLLFVRMIQQDVIQNLKEFFFNNQYDEDKYPHFRACDRIEDYEDSSSSNNSYVYTFYN
tara:strand:+ start:53 stop:301 length:249 start_codon:yes stop_codon:yes gene_type:complete